MANFQKLSPTIYKKEKFAQSSYFDAFEFVFNNKDLKNIAISGAYGAGKSSIFESYMRHWKKNKTIIHISLAHFKQQESCGENQEKTSLESKSIDETSLEAKIINQLIHQINPSRISKTNFIARIEDNKVFQVLNSLLIFLTFFIILILIFQNQITSIIKVLTDQKLAISLSTLLSYDNLLVMSIIPIVFTFFTITRIVLHSRGNNPLKKLSFKDFSIDLSEDNKESFFDKYLSEIRYLFEHCGSKIVAIEDIDRYYSCSIFEKIRELNTIVNYENNRKEPIRFFYIMKDDIFVSKDRTKFFDFIIPVIPIVDSSNSYSQLLSQLQESDEGKILNNRFLRGLSVYIDDMRILKNIINEFLVYRSELSKQELNPNKLLAFITYKNLFPKDFNDLQIGTGYLFSLIRSIDQFKEFVLLNDREKLVHINNRIQELNDENLINIDELNTLYLKPTINMQSVGGNNVDNFNTQIALVTEIRKKPDQIITLRNNSPISDNHTTKLNNLLNNPEYVKRKELIDQKMNNEIKNLENEKLNVESHIQSCIESHLVSKLFDSTNIDFFKNLPLKNDPNKFIDITTDLHYDIISFLLRNEIIDGDYKDYLTYFYDTELKIQDQTFIRSVFDEKPLSENHKLTNPQAVLQLLESISENNPAFINFDLFSYVCDNEMRDNAINYIKLSKKLVIFDVIIDYLMNGKNSAFLINILSIFWDLFYSDATANSKLNNEDRTRFLQLIIMYEQKENLIQLNTKNLLSAGIESNNLFFYGLDIERKSKIIENLLAINIKFRDVSSIKIKFDYQLDISNNQDFLTDIYQNNLYEITVGNIHFWLNKIYKINDSSNENKFFSNIFSRPEEPLSSYVLENIDHTLAEIISKFPKVFFIDNQITIHQILDSDIASLDSKADYIEHLGAVVEDISEIQDVETINLLIAKNLIKFTTNNLLALFRIFEKTFSPEFIGYLSNHENENVNVKDNKINYVLYPNEFVVEFFNKILIDTSINQKVTEVLLRSIRYRKVNQTEVLADYKADALINNDYLVMNVNNLEYIRTNHEDLVLKFEKNNLEKFMEILQSEQDAYPEEIVNLLESDLSWQDQQSLLSKVDVCIPYKKTYLYPGIKKIIINRLLDSEDISNLLDDPEAQSEKLISPTCNTIIKNSKYIIENEIVVPFVCMQRLITNKSIPLQELIEIFSNSMVAYTSSEIKECICTLPIPQFIEIYNRRRPKLDKTVLHLKIMGNLEKKKIASYKKTTDRIYLLGTKNK